MQIEKLPKYFANNVPTSDRTNLKIYEWNKRINRYEPEL